MSTITISLHWWYAPILLIVVSLLVASRVGKSQGDYDLFHPSLGLAVIAAGVAGALGIIVAKWLL